MLCYRTIAVLLTIKISAETAALVVKIYIIRKTTNQPPVHKMSKQITSTATQFQYYA